MYYFLTIERFTPKAIGCYENRERGIVKIQPRHGDTNDTIPPIVILIMEVDGPI